MGRFKVIGAMVLFSIFILVLQACLKTNFPPNLPPSKPDDPVPANGATNVSLSPILEWNCSDPEGDKLTYDIYFGEDAASLTLIKGNIESTSCEVRDLQADTTYYWKVVAKDNWGNKTVGDIWHFTTIPPSPGTLKWKYGVAASVLSSPALGKDGTIYAGAERYLYAISCDGTLKWKYEFEEGDVYRSSPAIGEDGTIYIGCSDHYIYAINPDGTLKWKYETGYDVRSTPLIGKSGTIYIGSMDGYLYALDTSGVLKWKCKIGEVHFSSPVISEDGTIYIGNWNCNICAIYADDDLAAGQWPMYKHDPQHTGRK